MRLTLPAQVVLLAAPAAVLLALAACSTDDGHGTAPTTPEGGASPEDAAGMTPEDAAGTPPEDAQAPLPEADEVEPNDGTTATEIGAMTVPGIMNGKIDPANDVDIFAVTIAPGDYYEWTLSPVGEALAPHLTVFDTAPGNENPTRLGSAPAGQPVVVQHLVLHAGSFVAAVRDARNVPSATGQGGPGHGYRLTAEKKARAPVAVTLPSTRSGTLASLSAIDLYAFTLSQTTGLDVVVRAARKAPPSTLDSRLSLFDVNGKKGIGTNDDIQNSTDSQLGGELPPGTYVVVLESEGTNPADLSYEIDFTLR
jgi:hypothetical protein